jgi:hypothetical protein
LSDDYREMADVMREFADARDVLADIIFGMKTKAEVELGVTATSVGVSAGLAVVTDDPHGARRSPTALQLYSTGCSHETRAWHQRQRDRSARAPSPMPCGWTSTT